MKRVYLVVLASVLLSTAVFSQKGNNVIGVGGDLSFPIGDFGDFYKTGVGIYGKAMLGVGKAGHVTFTSSYSAYKIKTNFEGVTSTIGLAPVLIGYRHNFDGFFVEPQIGYAIANIKVTSIDMEEPFTDAGGNLAWAASVGYVFNQQVEISARYQGSGNNGTNMNVFGVRLGYNFSLKRSK